jgi:hypothetical protein
MEEHTIELPQLLKGLSQNGRMVLWQAMTIDILGEMLKSNDDRLHLGVLYDDARDMVRVDVAHYGHPPTFSFWGERVARQ